MIGLPARTRVWLVAGHTDMRKGFDGLSAMVQTALDSNPFCGHVFVFRGKRGDMLKALGLDPFAATAYVFGNRRRDRVKILLWDRNGYWLLLNQLTSYCTSSRWIRRL